MRDGRWEYKKIKNIVFSLQELIVILGKLITDPLPLNKIDIVKILYILRDQGKDMV